MNVDARGGLWLDNPLLVLGVLSLIWVLVATLHDEPWLLLRGSSGQRADSLNEPASPGGRRGGYERGRGMIVSGGVQDRSGRGRSRRERRLVRHVQDLRVSAGRVCVQQAFKARWQSGIKDDHVRRDARRDAQTTFSTVGDVHQVAIAPQGCSDVLRTRG